MSSKEPLTQQTHQSHHGKPLFENMDAIQRYEEEQAKDGAQMSQAEKKCFADFLIDTTNGFDATSTQVSEIFRQLSVL